MSLFTQLRNTTNIPSQFPQRGHPKPPPDNNGDQPVQTNKFYGNMLLDKRNLSAYPLPYSVWWTGTETNGFCGLAISHEDASARVLGPTNQCGAAQYFFSPSGIMNLCMGASWNGTPAFSTNAWGPMSVNAVIRANNAEVVYPICNGMGFVTGVYTGVAPQISSQVGFASVSSTVRLRNTLSRINVRLNNNTEWCVYVTLPAGGQAPVTQRDGNHFTINVTQSNMLVQIAKVGGPINDWQAILDSAAGAYPTRVTLEGGVTSDYQTAVYTFDYHLAGSSTGNGTLIYAAPHHVESFTADMNGRVTNLYMNSPSLGTLRASVATKLEMFEHLPTNLGFLPWYRNKPMGDDKFAHNNFSSSDTAQLVQMARQEINNGNIAGATNLDSMYFSGKVMSKFANILLVLTFIAKDQNLANEVLNGLKAAFDTFIQNKQRTPLYYDQNWKGLVSQAGVQNAMADFGNTYYNDHHFHYGYFIHAAAVLAKCDQELAGGQWVQSATNRDWVNSLVRDIGSFGGDTTYPESRSFDWFSGHSIAHGLFASADGKDEESSSEDYNCWYGVKLWGQVIQDRALESRGNLVLAIEARAMNHYMLYGTDNQTVPSQYRANCVSGIRFENKIEHSTYFGTNIEYIQGIHMIPITPVSSLVRSPQFVQHEWDTVISKFINNVDSGWKGTIYLNYALTNPQAAYQFFASDSFQSKWLDDGLSRTWAIAFTKSLL